MLNPIRSRAPLLVAVLAAVLACLIVGMIGRAADEAIAEAYAAAGATITSEDGALYAAAERIS